MMTQQSEKGSVVAEIENVSLKYGKTVALNQVSLSLPAGCMIGLDRSIVTGKQIGRAHV